MNNKLMLTLFLICTGYLTSIGQCDCTSDQELDPARKDCSEQLSFTSTFNMSEVNGVRMISSNSIPSHMVGEFGGGGMNGPNAISEQSETYEINTDPTIAAILTPLLSTSGAGPNAGPQYSFGVLLNGVELDPVAAEPFPHEGFMNPNVNWEWNLEALNVRIGLDCNNAHVQPTGKYHYHGSPTLYLEGINISDTEMTMIGYAADGFPIYYKYGYTDPADQTSDIVTMTSSYRLKEGCRPGDGVTAPCDEFNGVYSNDYEYVEGLGTLDEANGRHGITDEFPDGTYYYVITEEFPSVPRYFRGTPSTSFRLGPNMGQSSCSAIEGGDTDNDGICKIDDCNDFDASVGSNQPVGTPCDDGNDMTENDQIQADGCNCMGTETSTSTHEVVDLSVQTFPNPVSDVLHIAVDGNNSYSTHLYDIKGNLMASGSNLKSMSMDRLPEGFYLLKIQEANASDYIVKSILVAR